VGSKPLRTRAFAALLRIGGDISTQGPCRDGEESLEASWARQNGGIRSLAGSAKPGGT